jgi:hypothetical protein
VTGDLLMEEKNNWKDENENEAKFIKPHSNLYTGN